MNGKLQPQAIELEEAVLGALMLHKDAINDITGVLTPECFYKEVNGWIFAVIQHLSNNAQPVDIMTVTSELKKRGQLDGAGGAYHITSLTNRVASASNIEAHARIVKEKAVLRDIIAISSELSGLAFNDDADPFELMEKQEKFLQTVHESLLQQKSQKPWNELLKDVLRDHDIAAQNKNITGVPSTFSLLNHNLGGYQQGDLIILAARPSIGKSAFMMNEAIGIGKLNIPVAVFSLEMSTKQLMLRIAAGESEIDSKLIQKGKLYDEPLVRLNHSLSRLYNLPIFIDDTPSLSIYDMRARARRLKNKYGIQMIFVDYLQLMRGEKDRNGNREQEVSSISRGLKAMAKELDVPVFALAQLSRASEKRGHGALPILSDLRESGSIEQDADVVMFLHRDEYYNILEAEDGSSTIGKAVLKIAKNRNGALDQIILRFQHEFVKFSNYNTYDNPNPPF